MGEIAPVIRPMTLEDVEAVSQMEQDNFADAWPREALEQELVNFLAKIFVLELEGKVRGYAELWQILDEVQLNRYVIAGPWQGQGLGKYFLGNLIRYFWERDCTSMTLEVRNNNIPAQKLYASLGFVQVGCRRDYYGKGVDALIMWLYKK